MLIAKSFLARDDLIARFPPDVPFPPMYLISEFRTSIDGRYYELDVVYGDVTARARDWSCREIVIETRDAKELLRLPEPRMRTRFEPPAKDDPDRAAIRSAKPSLKYCASRSQRHGRLRCPILLPRRLAPGEYSFRVEAHDTGPGETRPSISSPSQTVVVSR